jgi:hypothetical protein
VVDSISDDGKRELFRVFMPQQSALSTRNTLTVCITATKCIFAPNAVSAVLFMNTFYKHLK